MLYDLFKQVEKELDIITDDNNLNTTNSFVRKLYYLFNDFLSIFNLKLTLKTRYDDLLNRAGILSLYENIGKNVFYYFLNEEKIIEFYNKLADENSKNNFINYLKLRIKLFLKPTLSLFLPREEKHRNEEDIYDWVKNNYGVKDDNFHLVPNYKYLDLVKVEKGDFVIDAGAFIGDSAFLFLKQGASKIFCFEIDDNNFKVLKNYLEKVNNVYLYKVGLYSENKKMFMAGSFQSVALTDETLKKEVEVLKLDDFVEENAIEKIDFIKMDIEGAEIEALKGAVKTLSRFSPKLAICLYHKKDDIWKIPEFIENLNLGYKFYFDWHGLYDAILYAKVL